MRDDAYTLKPVAARLSELLGKKVIFANDCVGPDAKAKAKALKAGDVLLLENLRFYKEEVIKDKAAKEDAQLRQAKDKFAQELAAMADVYVDDAFGTAHRDNASMYTVPAVMEGKPRVTGFLIEKELKFLGDTVKNPQRPFVAILGGKKVSDKIGVIENLIPKVNRIIIGGAMAYTFLKARGKAIGESLCEDDFMDKAIQLLDQATEAGCEVMLPPDHVVVRKLEAGPSIASPWATSIRLGRRWTSVLWPQGVCRESSTPRPSSGTGRWASSRSRRSIREPTRSEPSPRRPSGVPRASSAVAIVPVPSSSLVCRIRSPTSRPAAASLEFLEGKKFKAIEILDDK